MRNSCFVTGCDWNTEWMLPWFIKNLKEHNPDIPIVFANFGVSPETITLIFDEVEEIIDMSNMDAVGWFKKPQAMIEASKLYDWVCWLDSDCEVLGDIKGVFDHVVPNKLSIAPDKPWTTRRRDKWHNTGVVAFKNTPKILTDWRDAIRKNPVVGDQEVLHLMMDSPLMREIYIEDLPNEYNWLRLQLLDGQDSNKKLVMHWTGPKGKAKIKELM